MQAMLDSVLPELRSGPLVHSVSVSCNLGEGTVASRLREVRRSPSSKPSVLAFYLPQYHQDPDNDEFWALYESTSYQEAVRAAKFAFDLVSFTGRNLPLIDVVCGARAASDGAIYRVEDLVGRSRQTWLDWIGDAAIPDWVEGDSELSRKVN